MIENENNINKDNDISEKKIINNENEEKYHLLYHTKISDINNKYNNNLNNENNDNLENNDISNENQKKIDNKNENENNNQGMSEKDY